MSGHAHKRAISGEIENRLLKHYRRGDYQAVVRKARSLGRHDRLPAATLLVMAASFERIGQFDEAETMYRAVVAAAPDHADNHYCLADLLRRRGQLPEALAVCEQGLASHPRDAGLLFLYGQLLHRAVRPVEALNVYCRLLAAQPDHADALHSMGVTLVAMGQIDRAIEAFCTTVMVDPDHGDAIRNLGQTLTLAGRLDEAVSIFRLALQQRPENHFLRLRKAYQQLHICDWSEFGEVDALLDKAGPLTDAGTPFAMLSFADEPAIQLRHARACAAKFAREAGPAAPIKSPQRQPGERIRIGYLSADFHDHATMHLMAGLFREHDRQAFAIHAFSIGPDCPDQAMRRLVVESVDSFTDLRNVNDDDAARRIRAADLDMLIDLKGYTKESRTGIVARRPAPVQISYVGYPGTMGADFMDYLVADATVIPAAQRRHYSESIIHLPGSYQPTNDERRIASEIPSRDELGLPERGFVFCCFNQTYKVTPLEFDIWIGLLREIEGSVLWLLGSNAWAQANLCAEAERRGVDPRRLIFAGLQPQADHLARIARADLFLDTFRINAHTTMSDALWAGLPAVSLAGRSFAARVGASVLAAAGLPELIVQTAEDYERLSLELARNPDRLATIRAKLRDVRTDCALFDTKRYTRAFETGLRRVHERAQAGLPPADVFVD